MWISCRFGIIGLHLLFLTHIAHTFVLLTANMDDVKKLARKFVSDSLAETIAEFIAKATKTMAINTSEENKINGEDSHHVSEENNMYNVERHGPEMTAQVAPSPRYKEETNSPEKKEDNFITTKQEVIKHETDSHSTTDKKKSVIQPYIDDFNKKKHDYSERIERPTRYAKVERNKVKQNAYPLQTHNKNYKSEQKYEENTLRLTRQPRYLDDDFDSSIPTLSNKDGGRKKIRREPHRLMGNLNPLQSDKATDVATAVPDKVLNTTYLASYESLDNDQLKQRAVYKLTTRKDLSFNQYQNYYYPKAEFKANGGSIGFRKMSDNMAVRKWWEKVVPL